MKPGDSELPLNLLTTEKKKTTELFAALSPRFSVCLPSTRLVRESDSAISHSTRAWSKGEQLLFTQPDKDTARKLQQITHPGLIADRVGLSSRISVTFLIPRYLHTRFMNVGAVWHAHCPKPLLGGGRMNRMC